MSDDNTQSRDGINPEHARIPEDLIDAALDGELCEELENEITSALRYDADRLGELNQTLDTISALRSHDCEAPDFQLSVMNTLDTRDSFLTSSMRRMVRTGRLAAAAAILLALMLVSALQTLSPRFSTIAPHATPVGDVASALGGDAQRIVDSLELQMQLNHASNLPWLSTLGSPYQITTVSGSDPSGAGLPSRDTSAHDILFVVRCEGVLIPEQPAQACEPELRSDVLQLP